MTALKNHPGLWLRDDAAAAFDAYEDKYGVIGVNSAGRTVAEQQKLIDRWNRGGAGNRPPHLYKPAMPASSSPHVIGGGLAVDVTDYQRFKQHAEEFGFHWYGPGDVVHFNFRGRPAAGAPAFPLPAGSYFGPKSGPVQSVSGYYSHRDDLRVWQQRMKDRGWDINPDGLYGDQTARIALAFQKEKGLAQDALIGPATWAAAWTAPIT